MTTRRKVLGFFAGAVGVVSMLIGAAKVFLAKPASTVPVVKHVTVSGNEQSIIIFLLGALIAIVVVQTFDFWVPLEKSLDVLAGAAPEMLEGEASIYAKASQLVAAAERSVKAATFRRVHEEHVPGYWATLVGRIAAKGIDYKLVYGYGEIGAVRAASTAHAAYFATGGGMTIEQLYFEGAVGVDLLLVDDHTMIMALPVVKNDPQVRRAMCISDRDLVKDVVSWFENYLCGEASSVRP